jgi:hypothetical protein
MAAYQDPARCPEAPDVGEHGPGVHVKDAIPNLPNRQVMFMSLASTWRCILAGGDREKPRNTKRSILEFLPRPKYTSAELAILGGNPSDRDRRGREPGTPRDRLHQSLHGARAGSCGRLPGDSGEVARSEPCFRVLARVEKRSLGMSAGNAVFTGPLRTTEPFSEGTKKNPSTNRGVRWSGERDLNIYGE